MKTPSWRQIGRRLHELNYWIFRLVASPVTRMSHGLKIVGSENIPRSGPAILVFNHVSHIDVIMRLVGCRRHVTYLMWEGRERNLFVKTLSICLGAIPISRRMGVRRMRASLRKAAEVLKNGGLLGISAEGRISPRAFLHPLLRGPLVIRRISRTDCPIIPMYLDGMWGARFTNHNGILSVRRWSLIKCDARLLVGESLPSADTIADITVAMHRLSVDAFRYRILENRFKIGWSLQAYLATAKAGMITDASGRSVSTPDLLKQACGLCKFAETVFNNEEYVGVVMSADLRSLVIIVALLVLGKKPVCVRIDSAGLLRFKGDERGRLKSVIHSHSDIVVPIDGLRSIPIDTFFQRKAKEESLTPPKSFWGQNMMFGVQSRTGAICLFSIQQMKYQVDAVSQAIGISRGDILILVLPPEHPLALLFGLWFPLLAGMPVHWHTQWATVENSTPASRATVVITCGSLAGALDSQQELPGCRACWVLIDRAPDPELLKALKYRKTPFYLAWFVPRAGGIVTVNVPRSKTDRGWKRGSVGRPLPGTAIRFQTSSQNQIPELEVLVPFVAKQPEKSSDSEDDWLLSGFSGTVDRENFVTLVATDE